jgi:Cu+-exporting ATPase
MGDPLASLPPLLRLSRQLVRVIQQGIYIFAFGMNGLGILLSAWGWLSPVGGALFHEFASIAVMLSALRLLWFERWETTRFGRFSGACSRCAESLASALSPSEAVYRVIRYRGMFFQGGIAAVTIGWLCWNFVLLTEAEQALVTRYGRYETTLTAGLHLRWPPPFERIRRVEVDRLRALPIGFRSTAATVVGRGAYVAPVEWQAEHSERSFQPVAAESQLLAGDETAVELTAEVQYRISDLRKWLLGVAAPESTLRAAAESAVRDVVARRPLEEILADSRATIEAECLALLRQRMGPLDTGIDIASLALLDVHPPPQVVPAYRDVANALEEQEQSINLAQAEHARLVLSAAGEEAVRRLNHSGQAEGAGGAIDHSTSGAIAEWQLTDALWKELTKTKETGEMVLSGEGAARLIAAERDRTRTVEEARGRETRFSSLLPVLRADPTLTRFQFYWDAVEKALAARPLTILDPQAAGRRQLWLADPERFNLRNLMPGAPPVPSGKETPVPPGAVRPPDP